MTTYAIALANAADTAARFRTALGLALYPGANGVDSAGGVRPGGGAVTINAGTMTAAVDPFIAWVDGGVSTAQGGYAVVSDAAQNVTIANGHATLARIDTVCVQVRDNAFDSSGSTDAQVVVVQGTAAGSPVAPALPTNATALRNINVPAGASAGTGGLSSGALGTDRRSYLRGLPSANEAAVNRVVANQFNTSSTAYVVIPNSTERTALQKSFTKLSASSKLIVEVHGTCALSMSTGGVQGVVGLLINAVNVDVARTQASFAASADASFGGANEVLNVPAGTYNIEPVIKVNQLLSGTGATMTFALASTPLISYTIREVPA